MRKFLFLGACLVALASQPAMAQTGAPDIIVVKVLEGYATLKFDIARAGSKPEHREFSTKQLKEMGDGEYAGGQAEYTRLLLAELMQKGYSLTTTYSAGGAALTTLVFTKRQ